MAGGNGAGRQRQADKVAALRRSRVFCDLPQRHLKALARYTQESTADAGQVIASEGEAGNRLCILLSGSCVVERGGRQIATVEAGDCFGEMSLLDGMPRSATVTTSEACELLSLGRSDFEHCLKVAPGLNRALLKQLSLRLREREAAHTD